MCTWNIILEEWITVLYWILWEGGSADWYLLYAGVLLNIVCVMRLVEYLLCEWLVEYLLVSGWNDLQ
jgi:hypothetical protein